VAANAVDFIAAWHWRPDIIAVLLAVGMLYVIGWATLRRRGFRRVASTFRLVASLAGLGVIAVALLSPLDIFQRSFFSVHMIQHELLMVVAVPLVLLGHPLPIAFWGLPRPARSWAGQWIRPRMPLRRAFDVLTAAVPALAISTATLWAWHLPIAYDAVENNAALHNVQHFFFFGAALLFWWPVIGAPPIVRRMSLALLTGYLIVGMTQRSLLGALITLSNRVLYPHYSGISGITPAAALADQHVAGAVMWFGSGLVLLAITLVIIWRAPEPSSRRYLSSKVQIEIPACHPELVEG
jgi:cytochrome c oxidase assembly factor CtaG